MVSDNAGGGLRGLRAEPSDALFCLVRERYGIVSTTQPVDLGGSCSLNLKLDCGHAQHILRVYRPHVSERRLCDIHRVRALVAQAGIPCPTITATRDGCSWARLDDRLLEVEAFIPHDQRMNTWDTLQMAMPLLGRIHTVLATVNVSPEGRRPRFANWIPREDLVAQIARGTDRLRRLRPSSALMGLADAADVLARRIVDAERDGGAKLPRQLVHGDFWDSNVFFRDGRVVGVGDWAFMGERPRIDDLALTLFFACQEARTLTGRVDLLPRLVDLVDAYDRGLAEPLTELERMALPLAIARQPLWSIGGWVADLDDDSAAKAHAEGSVDEVDWALGLMDEMGLWQSALA